MISITAINKIKSNLQRTLYAINKVLQQKQKQKTVLTAAQSISRSFLIFFERANIREELDLAMQINWNTCKFELIKDTCCEYLEFKNFVKGRWVNSPKNKTKHAQKKHERKHNIYAKRSSCQLLSLRAKWVILAGSLITCLTDEQRNEINSQLTE